MAKKNFDSFLNTVKAPKISPEEIEEMTREVHHKPAPVAAIPVPVPEKPNAKPAEKFVAATKTPAPRGRKPKPLEIERTIRVSVDLPESVLINLKIKVTREQTDMKNYIRLLVEREMKKEFG